jgi:hypothetical protein
MRVWTEFSWLKIGCDGAHGKIAMNIIPAVDTNMAI